MGEFPNGPTQFQPGWKGGPGRPKGEKTLTGKLRALMEGDRLRGRAIAKGCTVADAFIEMCVREAMKGKYSFAKEIFERMEGKVLDRIELSETRGIRDLADEILAARSERAESEPESDGTADC